MNNLKVVFLSDWIINPYKELLSKHLSLKGAVVYEYLWSTFFLMRVFSIGKIDVLHLHTLHPFLLATNSFTRTLKLIIFVGQITILRLLGTKTVWTVHEWSDKLTDGKNNLSLTVAAIAVNSLSGVIVHCETTRQEIIKVLNLNPNRVLMIPHGNYIHYYPNQINTAEARELLNIPKERLIFVLFGNIYRYKGVIEAVEAFQMFDCDRASLLIAGQIGESGLEAEIKTAIGTNKNIILIPERIPDDAVEIYLNAADCILLPYTIHTTSGVAILAMSFGKACIAPRTGFFQDVINEQGGFLYELPHQEGLAKAMKQAYTNWDKLEEMGAHNLACMTKWNWNYVAELTLAAYKEIG